MIPYADFLYFGVLLYVAVPAVLLGLAGRAGRAWAAIATVTMLAVQYGGPAARGAALPGREIWIVAGYALFQWTVARAFLAVRARTAQRGPFYVALLLALLPLLAAKLVPAAAPGAGVGFLGISYVTLRALDVVICIQDRLITALSPVRFFACLFFFATISSGPIDRYRRFERDWRPRRSRAEFLADLDGAVQRIFTGFLYKFILAALIQRHWLEPAAARDGALATLSYMYAYSLYLFFDFAGYSAFAVGVSYLFGIHTPENFDRPFLARNIRDFWNRWHITLSWWLRDHVYMRFVMAAMKGRWFASRALTSALGLFLAFTLMGLWHGPALHYVLYGLYHGTWLALHEALGRWPRTRALWGDGPLWHAAAVLCTFHGVCFGFLLFSGHLTGGDGRAAAGGAPARVEGAYERATCEEIVGWARDAANPDEPVSVEIHADGVRLATVRADLVRRELADAGSGRGAHGFVYVPPTSLRDGWPREIAVTVAGTTVALGAPRRIACGPGVTTMDGHEGAVESADCAGLRGWARDMTRPEEPIAVDVYDGTARLATVAADQPRPAAGGGEDRHGFTWPLPDELRDGRPRSLAVRFAGSNVPLRHSPRVVACPDPSAPGAAGEAAATPPLGEATAGSTGDATPTAAAAAPAFADNGDGTISDLRTGLTWEKKIALDGRPDAANPHDADNCHPWGGTCAGSGAECRVDAECGGAGPCRAEDCQGADGLTIFEWVARLNAERFAGYDDWRLPRSNEIYAIMRPIEERHPAALAAFSGASCGAGCTDVGDPACSCTQVALYWAAPAAATRPDEAWMTLFYCQGQLFLDLKSNRFFVRAVRGEEAPP